MARIRPEGRSQILKDGVRRLASQFGYDIVKRADQKVPPDLAKLAELPPDFDDEMRATWAAVHPYTLTSPERVLSLCEAVRYVIRAGIPGDFVECGVWRGGSVLAMARTLLTLGVSDRHLYLFDTFTSMPRPGTQDVDIHGVSAARYHEIYANSTTVDPAYEYLPLDQVRAILETSGYPPDHFHCIEGLVEDTIPSAAPEKVALVRLDTDYYESTRHELQHLYPRVPTGGVPIVDDYGHWAGSRQATDEYVAQLADQGIHLLLHRIDYSARMVVVPSPAPTQARREQRPFKSTQADVACGASSGMSPNQ